MAKVVVMPKLGLTMTEGTVSQWLKKVGDEVKEGEPFFEVETDKLTNTIEASASGVVRHFFVEAGTTVPVLAKVAIIAAADEDISALIADAAPAAAAPVPVPSGEGEKVLAPMPGTILSVDVSQGQAVKTGDVLMIIEAMKMENEIVAPCDGAVAQILVQKGSTVDTNAVLAVIG